MTIDDLTIREARELARLFGPATVAPATPACPFDIGKNYFIRTVTFFWTGRVVSIVGQFLVLADAAWVADTGRFSEALKTSTLDEIEPVETPVIVSLGSIVDATEWTGKLPREVK